jgi:hypothetical protein
MAYHQRIQIRSSHPDPFKAACKFARRQPGINQNSGIITFYINGIAFTATGKLTYTHRCSSCPAFPLASQPGGMTGQNHPGISKIASGGKRHGAKQQYRIVLFAPS